MPLTSPSTGAYQIPTGVLKIAPWDGTTPPTNPTDYYDVGEVSDFKLKVDVKNLDHFSRRSGSKLRDKTVNIEAGYTGSMVMEEVTLKNLATFFAGSIDGNVVKINTALNKEYGIWCEGTNVVGEKLRILLWRAQLSPNGDFAGIAANDSWNALSFSISGLADLVNNPTDPYGDVEVLTTTTT